MSLLDISARCVGEYVPFEMVERHFQPRIPEPVQKRIVYWSFPRSIDQVAIYSTLANDDSGRCIPFQHGLELLEKDCVKNVLQIGFSLTGSVVDNVSYSRSSNLEMMNVFGNQSIITQRVSISFDRCTITSVTCSCSTMDMLWCAHVVALAVYRIRFPDKIELRLPISETLLDMSREQLQKFALHLIAEYHTDVLPMAQKLADELLGSEEAAINKTNGAPDPTAGAAVGDDHDWFLDVNHVETRVKNFLSRGIYYRSNQELLSMFAKIEELQKAADSNGPRMLTIITEQLLVDSRLKQWTTQHMPMAQKCRQIWDRLSKLWVSVVLNPEAPAESIQKWKWMLQEWSQRDYCPKEFDEYRVLPHATDNTDSEDDDSSFLYERNRLNRLRDDRSSITLNSRSIFDNAIEACNLDWESSALRRIIAGESESLLSNLLEDYNQNNKGDFGVWRENLFIAASRVQSLKIHGNTEGALRLAIAIVNGMKEKLQRPKRKHDNDGVDENYKDNWIGHPLNLVDTVFDILIQASTVASIYGHIMENTCSHIGKTIKHIRVQNSNDKSYLSLAYEFALIALSQQRRMPSNCNAQELMKKQEEALLCRLKNVEMDSILQVVLRNHVQMLLKDDFPSSLSAYVDRNCLAMHSFAHYLFNSLVDREQELAFQVGFRSVRLPLDMRRDGNWADQEVEWYIAPHVESCQYKLAGTMLQASQSYPDKLLGVLQAIINHIQNVKYLFKLAKDAMQLALRPFSSRMVGLQSARDEDMLNCSFKIGLQVCRLTLHQANNTKRTDMVRWLVTCAVDVGIEALRTLMELWRSLFTPNEATSVLVLTILSTSTLNQLQLCRLREMELVSCARRLALECSREEPQSCCLNALKICRKDLNDFNEAYEIVVQNFNVIPLIELFAIARFFDNCEVYRAYRVALLAMRRVNLAHNQETHYIVSDVYWACSLAHSIGKPELTKMIQFVIKGVHCAPVLADILRRCATPAPSVCIIGGNGQKLISYKNEPLNLLLDAAINCYINTTHERLAHISPRQYSDFISFLCKARDTFLLAENGELQFQQHLIRLKSLYKGKKKLMALVMSQFGEFLKF
ncbi:uncharacterized protein TRIADDRAFT_28605 [Trichoplax adhaerens]|uniref:SWIM-type domain-containing protein n=1 Tax=Trichoplax adhaerens TaxID=10228 RepID=B3S3Q8_TRIAD|nr:hypothetical protein TRIADDRAFT_28605 [Trichoplax adhaerens]EDV22322.1 hypothetical protein TRIADDRAFT_28605 [Trichoplax adhaerens]|eukprot:XP_002114866.1 hypothetical protein TRIADDRAFT_28605 [Trichoplax adhaerens]